MAFTRAERVGDVAIDLSNDGTLLIDATAKADTGSTANAHATVAGGIVICNCNRRRRVGVVQRRFTGYFSRCCWRGNRIYRDPPYMRRPNGTTSAIRTWSRTLFMRKSKYSESAIGRDASAALTNSDDRHDADALARASSPMPT
jgi:hypothetical protein